jgi:hypothetical protein
MTGPACPARLPTRCSASGTRWFLRDGVMLVRKPTTTHNSVLTRKKGRTYPCDGSKRYEPDGKRPEVVRRWGQQPCACGRNPQFSSALTSLSRRGKRTNQELQDAVCGPVRAPGRVHTDSQRVPVVRRKRVAIRTGSGSERAARSSEGRAWLGRTIGRRVVVRFRRTGAQTERSS